MYSFNLKIIKRNNGGSIAKSVAYICRTKMQKYLTNMVYDYTKQQDILYYEMILPENSPEKLYDLQTFCDEAERMEGRADSRLLRSIRIALPNDNVFILEDHIKIVKAFVKEAFVDKGMGAVFAIHDGKNSDKPLINNIHSHVLITTRGIDVNDFVRLKDEGWNKKHELLRWRKMWENALNNAYEDKGLKKRVSCDSYEVQGLLREKIEPTRHMGYAVHEMEKRGIRTKIGDINRDIIKRRAEKERSRQKEQERNRGR